MRIIALGILIASAAGCVDTKKEFAPPLSAEEELRRVREVALKPRLTEVEAKVVRETPPESVKAYHMSGSWYKLDYVWRMPDGTELRVSADTDAYTRVVEDDPHVIREKLLAK